MASIAEHRVGGPRGGWRADPLVVASIAFLAANLLHGADHIRQGTGRLTPEVFYGGFVLTISAVLSVWLVLRRHRHAPLVAAVVGLWSGLAVAASHLAPHWSAFSDPYPDLHLDALSWAVMIAEIATALVLGVIGVRALRRQGERLGAPAG
jgi:hypothetical protein